MEIKSAIRRILNSTAESIYLLKYKKNIKSGTVYSDNDRINIPCRLKRIRSYANAQYIVSDGSLPDRFIKKRGQIIILICEFSPDVFFGRYQRLLSYADYLLFSKNADVSGFLKEFNVNGIFSGEILIGYNRDVISEIAEREPLMKKDVVIKKRVLIYTGSLAQNGLTTSLLNLLSNLDGDSDYILTYRENSIRKNPERLNKLPDRFRKAPIAGEFCMSVSELICYCLYFKLDISSGVIIKRLEKFFRREWKRLFGEFNVSTAVQFTGYEYGIINLFEQFDGNRIIFVHNDMVSEIKQRNNQHLPTLKNAYCNYDTVALVTEDMRESARRISGGGGNMVVVPNCHDYKTVLKKSKMPVEFQPKTDSTISLGELLELLNSDTEKFITIGRFSPEKSHMRLIDAFKEYCVEYPDTNACLIIIGGRGELYSQTVEYARKSGGNIILIRSMENPMPVLKKCDLFILPSEYEGLGLVILEADSLGLPVVATDIPGPRSFMRKYGGVLIDDSKEGIISGMKLFREGKIKTMNVDYEEYNRYACECFKKIL